VPLAIGRVPVLPIAGLVATCVLLQGLERWALVLGVALVPVGLLAWWTVERRRTPMPIVEPGANEMSRSKVTEADAAAAASALHVDPAAARWTVEELQAGMEVELEHGRVDPDTNVTDDDLLRTAKIALAHLNEIPDYYQRLAVMEEEGRAAWRDGRP